jgi:hypothetical protein
VSKQSLALPHPQVNLVAPTPMLGQYRSIPECGRQAKLARGFAQVALEPAALCGIERARSSRPLALTQRIQPAIFEAPHPALHRCAVLTKQLRDFPKRLRRVHQQQPVQPMVVA